MSKRRFQFLTFVGMIGVLSGSMFLTTFAFSDSQPTKHFNALASSLTSKEEFIGQFQESGTKPEVATQISFRESSIGKDLGVTESITYYDRSDQIDVIPAELSVLKGTEGFDIQSSTLPPNTYSYVQLDVRSTLSSVAEYLAPPPGCKKTFGYYNNKICHEARDRLEKTFEKKGFLDPERMKSEQTAQLESQYTSLVNGKLAAADFSHWVLAHPKIFSNLPSLLSRARTAGNSAIVQCLQDVLAKALLLALDAMIPGANFNNSTYPFYDDIVSANSLLNVMSLYDKLKAQGAWPQVIDLSIQDRQNLGGIYTEKAADRWKVKGFYLEEQNQVRIDLENSFYENVFVYFHELWHVAWSHSSQYKAQIVAIQNLLKDADSDANQKALRAAALQFISTNEFLAIDQQVKLFHAVGFETEDWEMDTTASALAWHDSYIGKDAYRLQIPMRDRGQDWFLRQNHRWLLLVMPLLGVDELNKEMVDTEVRDIKVWKFKKVFDESYWRNQLTSHSELFESRYFGEVLDSVKEIQPVDPNLVVQAIADIYIPPLSCSDIARIRKALGDSWRFGFPFEHTISDPDNCPAEKHDNSNGGLSTDGSHPGVDAFPSLEGSHSDK